MAGPSSDQSRLPKSGQRFAGSQLLRWEVATAAAGRILGHQTPSIRPDVESAEGTPWTVWEGPPGRSLPRLSHRGSGRCGLVVASCSGMPLPLPAPVELAALAAGPEHGYVSIRGRVSTAYRHAVWPRARRTIANRTPGPPPLLGSGPRFLHSTGPVPQGGPATGVYLQITAAHHQDLPIPGRNFTFGDFIHRQAGGDAQVLADRVALCCGCT